MWCPLKFFRKILAEFSLKMNLFLSLLWTNLLNLIYMKNFLHSDLVIEKWDKLHWRNLCVTRALLLLDYDNLIADFSCILAIYRYFSWASWNKQEFVGFFKHYKFASSLKARATLYVWKSLIPNRANCFVIKRGIICGASCKFQVVKTAENL